MYRKLIILLDVVAWVGYSRRVDCELKLTTVTEQNGKALMNGAARYLNDRDAAGARRAACRRTPLRALRSLPPKRGKGPHIRFCETNPILFECKTSSIYLGRSRLLYEKVAKIFGFVLENEPNLEVF